MSKNDDRQQPNDRVLNRRSILLGSTSLAAASALGSGPLAQVAQAQQPAPTPATSGGSKPNISLSWATTSAGRILVFTIKG